MENLKHNRAEILKSRDLNVNYGKAEQYIINRTNNEWTLCNYLGSILDTGEDIGLRKILAIAAANQLKIIYNDKKITPETKIKAVKTINTFQRRLLRTYVLNANWPNIIKNEDVYRKTAATEWSNIIRKRRLKWFGKVIRADESTPVKRAFNYASASYQGLSGNQRQLGWALLNQTFVI